LATASIRSRCSAELRELGAANVRGHREALPPLGAFDPADCHTVLDSRTTRERDARGSRDVFIFVMDDMELTFEPMGAEPTASAAGDVAMAAASTGTATERAGEPVAAQVAKAGESVRVPAERLDELMNRVGELVIAQSRLAQLADHRGAVDEVMLRAISEDIERLSSELRDTTMVLRMMPVGSLFGRFPPPGARPCARDGQGH
jgi:two-component system chemotaxis sensor kinase CheA